MHYAMCQLSNLESNVSLDDLHIIAPSYNDKSCRLSKKTCPELITLVPSRRPQFQARKLTVLLGVHNISCLLLRYLTQYKGCYFKMAVEFILHNPIKSLNLDDSKCKQCVNMFKTILMCNTNGTHFFHI